MAFPNRISTGVLSSLAHWHQGFSYMDTPAAQQTFEEQLQAVQNPLWNTDLPETNTPVLPDNQENANTDLEQSENEEYSYFNDNDYFESTEPVSMAVSAEAEPTTQAALLAEIFRDSIPPNEHEDVVASLPVPRGTSPTEFPSNDIQELEESSDSSIEQPGTKRYQPRERSSPIRTRSRR
jgi:hypothetical protein